MEAWTSWNPFSWQPATLYFRTQDEAYSYGDRPQSGWNPIVGAPPHSLSLSAPHASARAGCVEHRAEYR
jgi:hypothetical protein